MTTHEICDIIIIVRKEESFYTTEEFPADKKGKLVKSKMRGTTLEEVDSLNLSQYEDRLARLYLAQNALRMNRLHLLKHGEEFDKYQYLLLEQKIIKIEDEFEIAVEEHHDWINLLTEEIELLEEEIENAVFPSPEQRKQIEHLRTWLEVYYKGLE